MPVESAADRAALLADFGETAIYTPVGGAAVDLTAVFDTPYLAVADGERDVVAAEARPTLWCRSADLPAGAAIGDAVACGGVDYAVADLQPDGQGMTLIVLAAAA